MSCKVFLSECAGIEGNRLLSVYILGPEGSMQVGTGSTGGEYMRLNLGEWQTSRRRDSSGALRPGFRRLGFRALGVFGELLTRPQRP